MNEKNPVKMIDISDKMVEHREAEAVGKICLKKETLEAIKSQKIEKGDPISVAEVACILAVKRTHEIIPLCHNVPIASVSTEFDIMNEYIEVRCRVVSDYKTGIEMESLTGVTVALLTIWDMVKYMEKDNDGQYPSTSITGVRVIEKKKG
jgi:cyclic pyranopterin phosphate synthase